MNNSHTDNSVRPLALATAGEGVHTLEKVTIDDPFVDVRDIDGDSELEAKAKELGISYNHLDDKIPPCTGQSENIIIGTVPPEGYTIGDVYLKHGLFDEAKKLERKVNRYGIDEKGAEKRKLVLDDALGEERKGWERVKSVGRAVLHGARENYKGRMDYACRQCDKYVDEMKMIKIREGTINNELTNIANGSFAPIGQITGTDLIPKKILAYQSELKDLKDEYANVQKKAFDAYTKLVVFATYTSRIENEIQTTVMGSPSKQFKMLRNSDQLI